MAETTEKIKIPKDIAYQAGTLKSKSAPGIEDQKVAVITFKNLDEAKEFSKKLQERKFQFIAQKGGFKQTAEPYIVDLADLPEADADLARAQQIMEVELGDNKKIERDGKTSKNIKLLSERRVDISKKMNDGKRYTTIRVTHENPKIIQQLLAALEKQTKGEQQKIAPAPKVAAHTPVVVAPPPPATAPEPKEVKDAPKQNWLVKLISFSWLTDWFKKPTPETVVAPVAREEPTRRDALEKVVKGAIVADGAALAVGVYNRLTRSEHADDISKLPQDAKNLWNDLEKIISDDAAAFPNLKQTLLLQARKIKADERAIYGQMDEKLMIRAIALGMHTGMAIVIKPFNEESLKSETLWQGFVERTGREAREVRGRTRPVVDFDEVVTKLQNGGAEFLKKTTIPPEARNAAETGDAIMSKLGSQAGPNKSLSGYREFKLNALYVRDDNARKQLLEAKLSRYSTIENQRGR